MDKDTFIASAYDEVRSLFDTKDVTGKPLIAVLHRRGSRSTDFPGSRAVTLRVQGQLVDRGERAVFTDALAALCFYNAVMCALKKMEPPITTDRIYRSPQAFGLY